MPHHSSLTRIRQRWGAARFERIFKRTVSACLEAKIATGEVVHIDTSLIRADVSWESLVESHVAEVLIENDPVGSSDAERSGSGKGKHRKVNRSDPDASMATTARNKRLEPSYKQHTTVDDLSGVVVDVEVTTGVVDEGDRIEDQIEAVDAIPGVEIATVTADAGYA